MSAAASWLAPRKARVKGLEEHILITLGGHIMTLLAAFCPDAPRTTILRRKWAGDLKSKQIMTQ